VVGQTVRYIRKYAQFHAVGRPRRRPGVKTVSRGFTVWQSLRLVTGVGRADGDLVAAPRETAREAPYEAWYAPVGPCSGGVGCDVKDSKRPGSQ
jgi:hypothetical protein